VTIVPLDDVPTFLRDSLAIVRKGVATARSLNQSNPALGIMADLPEKVDYEIMVVSSSQFLNRQTSVLSSDTGIESYNSAELSGDRDSETSSSRENESSLDGDRSLAGKLDSTIESSIENNNKTGSSTRNSVESASDGSGGTSMSIETDKSDGVGLAGSTDNDLKTTNQTANTRSTDTKTDKSNTAQKGSTFEWNGRWARAFDTDTGRWGMQSIAANYPGRVIPRCS